MQNRKPERCRGEKPNLRWMGGWKEEDDWVGMLQSTEIEGGGRE